jgi:hypothetical protein
MSSVSLYQLLSKKDKDLAAIYKRFGEPPAWQREPGFATLIQITFEYSRKLEKLGSTPIVFANISLSSS